MFAQDFLGGREYKIEDCYSEHESSYNDRLHFHDFYELSAIYEGTSRFLVNGSLFTMEKRSIQLIRPSDYHRQQAGEGVRDGKGRRVGRDLKTFAKDL